MTVFRRFTALLLAGCLSSAATAAELPAAAQRTVDFHRDIQPLLEGSCVQCHAKGKTKGGYSIETREAFLRGGDSGPAAVSGQSGTSLLVEMVAGIDPEEVMPKKGQRWTAEQVGLLRAWIDQGASWPENVTFKKAPPENLRRVALRFDKATAASGHPLDALLQDYFTRNNAMAPELVDDRVFVRRVYLDLVGLLPRPEQLQAFLDDPAQDKRAKLVASLLADRRGYTEHWLTFWNDLLRNDYRGTGFIDGGRKQITGWLYQALLENWPYDRVVRELVNPGLETEGFTAGVLWRGKVNASMTQPMQAAQSVSQVFMGVNLKCASCHDSFINDWSLTDAFGLAAVFSESPLEMVHCDKPTGKTAAAKFLYSELGELSGADRSQRVARLAELLTSGENGRLARTIVNRLWGRLFGRALVEPVDDMDQPAWDRAMLDWLAEDFVAHGHDLKHLLARICTSQAYQLPSVETPAKGEEVVAFRGPLVRRLTAEQFHDAVSGLTEDWARLPESLEIDFARLGLLPGVEMARWIWTPEPNSIGVQRKLLAEAQSELAEASTRLKETTGTLASALAQDADAEEASVQAESAAAAVARAREKIKAAQTAPAPGEPRVILAGERHRVAFRKEWTLPAPPREAWAVVLATQAADLKVNGRDSKPKRGGRIAIHNLGPLLQAGVNVISLDVSSHTEKQMNAEETKAHPGSLHHLNARPGAAFYVRCVLPGGLGLDGQACTPEYVLQCSTDETWKARRHPEGDWRKAGFNDANWATAEALPIDADPVDEGPGLQPINRQDFANRPLRLGRALSSAVSVVAQPGGVRASLLAADSLQVALDRPNREVIVPVRAAAATTFQALELTNGATLNEKLRTAAPQMAKAAAENSDAWINRLFLGAVSRPPTPEERTLALAMLGAQPTPESVADLLWALVNLPEFQLLE